MERKASNCNYKKILFGKIANTKDFKNQVKTLQSREIMTLLSNYKI